MTAYSVFDGYSLNLYRANGEVAGSWQAISGRNGNQQPSQQNSQPVGRISRRRNPPSSLPRGGGLRSANPPYVLADDIVARRIDAGDIRLTAVEWKSGAIMRIVDVVAPFGGEAEMRGQIIKTSGGCS